MDGHELISARFSDSNHLNVITLWKDKDNNVVEQLISADPTQPQWNQLMKHKLKKKYGIILLNGNLMKRKNLMHTLNLSLIHI